MLWINRHNFNADEAFDLVLGVADATIAWEHGAALIADHLTPR